MWLQRVIFNVERRLFGRDERQSTPPGSSNEPAKRDSSERVQLLQARLVDLDRRLALLR